MHENLSRSRDLDVAKGIGILLVVVGHGYSHSTNTEVLIYGFHMPFFFIVSGMIYGQKQEQFRFDFCKKIRTLIIPYLFFEFMWWLCIFQIVFRLRAFLQSLASCVCVRCAFLQEGSF